MFGGVAWFLLRRYTRGEPSEIDEAVWDGDGRLSFRRCLGTSVISEVVIGMGASIGREAAPKLLGGASGSVLAGWGGLSAQQRRLLVACGGGAGLAAVYNVPLAGALFTAEILIGSISLPVMLPAIACSWIATATAWIYLPDRATYPGIPDYRFTGSLMAWALLAGPVIGLVSAGYIRLIGWVSYYRATGTTALFAPVIAFGILGVIGIWYPQLFGNGLDMARDAFLGIGSARPAARPCSRSSRWSRRCAWAAAHPAACSPRRWPPARSSAARPASPGTWPGPARRPARSPWSARRP